MKRAIGIAVFSLLAASTVGAADLLSVYQDALANDAQIREADALRKASREARPQAWAALLPQIQGSGTVGRGERRSSQLSAEQSETTGQVELFNRESRFMPDSEGWQVDLRQNVFSWTNWANLRASNAQVAQAEADYRAAEQALIQRVAARYFAVLAAQDNLEAQQAAQEAFSRQLDQANKRFEVGLIAITDVQETKSARDRANADVIQAKRQLATAQEQLREITGQKYDWLAKPGQTMPLAAPSPAAEQEWVEMSLDQNLALLSSRFQADIAREKVRSAFGGHLPEIDLVASRARSNSNGTVEIVSQGVTQPERPFPTEQNDTTYGLQVTVPIFSGGLTQSRVREQQYRWIAAKERVTRTSRETERAARDAYLGVISEMARVEALRQGLESSQTALKATEAGYEVGTRTSVDVLDQRRLLVQAQTTYFQSRYDYLQNVIALRLAAGNLDPKTMEELNAVLTVTAPPAPAAPSP
jgi:outer membrane protein